MKTRSEQSRVNGRKGGRPRKAPKPGELFDLDSFPWRTHDDVPELTQDVQHSEFLSVEYMPHGRWRSVWIQKPALSTSGQPVQLADTEPRNPKEELNMFTERKQPLCNFPMVKVAGGGYLYCNAKCGHLGDHTWTSPIHGLRLDGQ